MSAALTLQIVTAINDASMIVSALTPLWLRATQEGREVTEAEVDAALAGLDVKIDQLDAAIVAAKARAAGA